MATKTATIHIAIGEFDGPVKGDREPRPGVSVNRWFKTSYYALCDHFNEVKSLDPDFHRCADCGHSWRGETRPEVPSKACATCARVAARKGTQPPAPESYHADVCTACGEWICPTHMRRTCWLSEGDLVCPRCLRNTKQLHTEAWGD